MKGKRKMGLIALALLFSTSIFTSQTIYADNNDFISDGGEYTLEYVLKYYNVFANGTIRSSHIVGPIVAGGDVGKTNGQLTNGFTFSDYDQGKSSYIKGKIYSGQSATGYWNEPQNGLYGCYQNQYVGSVNTITTNDWHTYINDTAYVYNSKSVYTNDEYVNFDIAFENFRKQSITLANNTTKVIGLESLVNEKYVFIQEGEVVKLSAELINYIDTHTNDPVIIVLVSNTNDASNMINTVITIEEVGEHIMPGIRISSSFDDIGVGYDNRLQINKQGTSLIWNIPYATKLTWNANVGDGIGHVVAPNADIYNYQGTYSGCQIALNFYGHYSEGHMQPYNSTSLEPSPDPKVDEPIVDEPIVDEPIIDEPIVDEPIVDDSIVDDPIVDDPIVDDPIVDDPIVDDPIIDEPTIDNPIDDEPFIDEPVINTPIIDDSIDNDPVIENIVIDPPFINDEPLINIKPDEIQILQVNEELINEDFETDKNELITNDIVHPDMVVDASSDNTSVETSDQTITTNYLISFIISLLVIVKMTVLKNKLN